ncbi:TPA: DNA integrity scanning protein DisA [Candidatus Bipolaricaulota bacterium]|nr:DNA integrity scanning protein DisA [Candidatus Bipolaricaulota bacterium]HIP99982.1 DNA integrity scanning protein DisA [Candidatus Bipolaricaulota bacterium]
MELTKEQLEILERTAPGTPLREAIDLIMQLGKGGLIVVADRDVISPLIAAGFELDAPFTPQAVAELSKMDRAVVVDPPLRTILYANAHLTPDPAIPSQETGTRHRAAEQTAKQLDCPVIAVSEERRRTTIYLGEWKYELQDPLTLLAHASQALLILDRYRAELNELLAELGPLEFERRVFPYHVAVIIQKIVQMLELEEELKRLLLELGEHRRLPERQLRGLMRGVREELELIVLDFQKDPKKPVEAVIQEIVELSSADRLSSEAVLRPLGFDEEDLERPLSSRGYRLLHKIPRLPMPVIERLVGEFGSLDQIERQGRRQLQRIKGVAEVRARAIKAGLRRFKAGYATGLEGF